MTISERIESYYIRGYGFPKKYYTDNDLDKFVKRNMITQEQANKIKALKTQEG